MAEPVDLSRLETRELYGEQEIRARVAVLASQLVEDYEGRSPLLIGVLKGALPFLWDLAREYQSLRASIHGDDNLRVSLAWLSSYEGTTPGDIRVLYLPDSGRVAGRDVLIVEDIVDTGATANRLMAELSGMEPASIGICTLLDKPARRTHAVELSYVGFEIPDLFVFGYGLDYEEQGRDTPGIHALR